MKNTSAHYCQYPTCVCGDTMDCPKFRAHIMSEVQHDYDNNRMPLWARIIIAIALAALLTCLTALFFI